MTIILRQATVDDQPAIDRAEQEIFGADAWSTDTVLAELKHPLSWYLIAEEGDKFAGYAGLRSAGPRGQGDIQTLAVVHEFRGRGVGGKLLDGLLERARHDQLLEVFLEVRADNEVAQELYLSRGFREIARRPGYYQPDGVDAVVMALDLDSVSQGDPR